MICLAPLTTLAAGVTGRVAKVRDRGVIRLIECADASKMCTQ